MTTPSLPATIAEAIRNARDYLSAHPDRARSADPAARATLRSGLRVAVEGPKAWHVETDMSPAVGGDGSAPSPGWLLRAALASCDTVLIAMQCAEEGVSLSRLETEVVSESDSRGLLGTADTPAGPLSMHVTFRIEVDGMDRGELSALVERALARSPVADAVRRAVPVRVELA